MPGKRCYTTEQIITKLREADILRVREKQQKKSPGIFSIPPRMNPRAEFCALRGFRLRLDPSLKSDHSMGKAASWEAARVSLELFKPPGQGLKLLF